MNHLSPSSSAAEAASRSAHRPAALPRLAVPSSQPSTWQGRHVELQRANNDLKSPLSGCSWVLDKIKSAIASVFFFIGSCLFGFVVNPKHAFGRADANPTDGKLQEYARKNFQIVEIRYALRTSGQDESQAEHISSILGSANKKYPGFLKDYQVVRELVKAHNEGKSTGISNSTIELVQKTRQQMSSFHDPSTEIHHALVDYPSLYLNLVNYLSVCRNLIVSEESPTEQKVAEELSEIIQGKNLGDAKTQNMLCILADEIKSNDSFVCCSSSLAKKICATGEIIEARASLRAGWQMEGRIGELTIANLARYNDAVLKEIFVRDPELKDKVEKDLKALCPSTMKIDTITGCLRLIESLGASSKINDSIVKDLLKELYLGSLNKTGVLADQTEYDALVARIATKSMEKGKAAWLNPQMEKDLVTRTLPNLSSISIRVPKETIYQGLPCKTSKEFLLAIQKLCKAYTGNRDSQYGFYHLIQTLLTQTTVNPIGQMVQIELIKQFPALAERFGSSLIFACKNMELSLDSNGNIQCRMKGVLQVKDAQLNLMQVEDTVDIASLEVVNEIDPYPSGSSHQACSTIQEALNRGVGLHLKSVQHGPLKGDKLSDAPSFSASMLMPPLPRSGIFGAMTNVIGNVLSTTKKSILDPAIDLFYEEVE